MEDLVSEASHDVADELMKIRGMGLWIAYVSLMAGMGVWHAQPVDRLMRLLEKEWGKVRCLLAFRGAPCCGVCLGSNVFWGEGVLRGGCLKLQG
jgi:hypothetical protein